MRTVFTDGAARECVRHADHTEKGVTTATNWFCDFRGNPALSASFQFCVAKHIFQDMLSINGKGVYTEFNMTPTNSI